ncbi:MAG: zinc ribbon domain-containing protein [Paludibacteraceae bacterium]|jgi:putative FmdB family regulatory protein|nr:zinc ribbon domain-containing protein [Paludibacteraceae bacterium]
MPTYDYQCKKCASLFEVFHRFGEIPSEGCPVCGSLEIKKSVSGFYLGNRGHTLSSNSATVDMMADLRENYGIESVQMKTGNFHEWYNGVKKDGSKVKEQMLSGEERQNARIAKKNRDFFSKPLNSKAIQKLSQTGRPSNKK